METVKITLKSAEAASRKELIIRFAWCIIVGFVLAIVGCFAAIAWIVQWMHILFTRKRHPSLARFLNAYMVLRAQLGFYCVLATDERPPLFPAF